MHRQGDTPYGGLSDTRGVGFQTACLLSCSLSGRLNIRPTRFRPPYPAAGFRIKQAALKHSTIRFHFQTACRYTIRKPPCPNPTAKPYSPY
ncbi:hypothetical protein [Kingella potus]|uniref:hypothetical protein n=1 Tax=Kingella potus TaxID=265175 RepID=UPI001FD095D7|nr:hypothetical protein [Kingella potus]UOP01135.1 hypothetical protein LVJ84_02060 [Kingella potus]